MYKTLFRLLNNCITLTKALIERNSKEIGKFSLNNEFIFTHNIGYQYVEMFEMLKRSKAMDVFFIYVASLERAFCIKYG